MEKELGVTFLTGHALENIKATKKEVTATANNQKLSAEMLLVSVGRSPVTDGLNAKAAGVEVDEMGTSK